MKKQRKKPGMKPKGATTIQNNAPSKGTTLNRRTFFRHLRNGAIGLAVVGGGGWLATDKVSAAIAEGNLSKIGNGMPTIVQIHDPQCPVCRALQREARHALRDFEDTDLQYLVANIRSEKGRALASLHGVPHVTLLLFDGQGELLKVLSGPNDSDFLRQQFSAHLAGTIPG